MHSHGSIIRIVLYYGTGGNFKSQFVHHFWLSKLFLSKCLHVYRIGEPKIRGIRLVSFRVQYNADHEQKWQCMENLEKFGSMHCNHAHVHTINASGTCMF